MQKLFSRKMLALLMGGMIMAGIAFAAPNPPSTLDADEIQYDTKTGIVTAVGNVRMLRDNATITGDRATYNSKTQEGVVEGNVVAVREDMTLNADKVEAIRDSEYRASGSVVLVSADRTFRGEIVRYYPQQEGYIVIEEGGVVESSDGSFRADYIEGWTDKMQYVGIGNAHVLSPPRDMEGGADRMEYFGSTAEQKRVILMGNAWLLQENNMARGKVMTVYLADERVVRE